MLKTKQIFDIRETAEDLVPDKLARKNYGLALIIMLCLTAFITVYLRKIPTIVPLFFTLPWGDARLAPRIFLYLLPSIIFLCILLNLILGKLVAKVSPLLPKILAVTTMVVACILLVALFGIMQSLVL